MIRKHCFQNYASILMVVVIASFLVDNQAYAQYRSHHRNDRQIIRAYPSVGITAAQIEGDKLKGFNKWGFTAGVGAMVSLSENDRWQLSIETDYIQRGAYGHHSSEQSGDAYGLYFLRLDYVDIPLTVFWTDPHGGMTIGAGLTYGRLVQQPHGVIRYQPHYVVPDTTDLTFLPNDFSIHLDFRFPIWRGLYFDARYQMSLIPIKRDWEFTEYHSANPNDYKQWSNNCYNRTAFVRLIYVFGTKKR